MKGTTSKKSPIRVNQTTKNKNTDGKKSNHLNSGSSKGSSKKTGTAKDGTNRGGARDNSGPKPNPQKKIIEQLKIGMSEHAATVVKIPTMDGGKVRMVEGTRAQLILERLFSLAIKGSTDGVKISASKEYYDRTVGKATQPVEMSGEIETKEQGIPKQSKALQAAREAYHAVILSESK